jgi:uncharacterized LabA/DUF88 family protein
MKRKTKAKLTIPKVYAFIDSQNLNLGTKKNIYKGKKLIYQGWELDFKKFRVYLADKFGVAKALLFIGYVESNAKLYDYLHRCGYVLVFKPTTKDRVGKPKGNIDAELVLSAAKLEYDQYDKAVIVSGDGDFYCLHDFLEKQGKLLRIIIPNPKSESSLLKRFHRYKTFLNFEQEKLRVKGIKNGRRRS